VDESPNLPVLGNIVHYDDPAIAGTFGIPGCVSINFTEFQNSGGGFLAVGWRYQLPYTCSDATIKGRAEILADDVMYNANEVLSPVLYKGALFTVRINETSPRHEGAIYRMCVKGCAAGEVGKSMVYAQDPDLMLFPREIAISSKGTILVHVFAHSLASFH
jgi:hypothetical protein